MGFFRGVFESGKAVVELGKDLGGIMSDGRKELTELMTDGFKEMVIKGNDEYKTSYERNVDAEQIVSKARYRYNAVFGDVQAKLYEVQQKVETHYKFKVDIYEQLKKEYSISVERYLQKYELKKKEYTFSSNLSSMNYGIPFNLSIESVISKLSGKSGLSVVSAVTQRSLVSIPVTIIAFDLIEQSKRVKEANNYLAEAKKFQARINTECERLKYLRSSFKYVEETVNEERRLIERLLIPLKKKMAQTEILLNYSDMTALQLKELDESIEIIALLEKTLTTEFLKDSAVITQQYQNVIKQLLEMEEQIYQGR